jgi:hypothetical protein
MLKWTFKSSKVNHLTMFSLYHKNIFSPNINFGIQTQSSLLNQLGDVSSLMTFQQAHIFKHYILKTLQKCIL